MLGSCDMLVVLPVPIMLVVTHGGSAPILLLNVRDNDGDRNAVPVTG